MDKDRLFLLTPGFWDNDQGLCYCPGCASVEGFLSYYPLLKEEMDITYVDFPRPRPPIVKLIGEGNQSAPVLVLAEKPEELPPGVRLQEHEGRYFIAEAPDITKYLSHKFKVARPHS